MNRKKKKAVAGLAIGAAALAAGILAAEIRLSGNGQAEPVYKEVTVERGTLALGVTESGSVTIGTVEQELELLAVTASTSESEQSHSSQGTNAAGTDTSSDSTENTLEIEELYVSVGQQVTEGEPLLKFTAESVQAYRDSLQDAVTEAEAAVDKAELSAKQQKLAAEYAYDLSVAEGSVAEANYQATLEELAENLENAQTEFDASASLVSYYQEQIDAGTDLSASLEKEQENYSRLYAKLLAAQSSYTTKVIEAEAAYEQALLASENAQSQYSVDVSGVENDVETAKDALADAKEAQEAFETYIGEEGILYSAYTGTVTAIAYEAKDTVSAEAALVTFANPEDVTISVSVSEEDVTDIAVGDVVNIALTAYEDIIYEGTVLQIDTSASSGSSTVSYTVTVAFTGDVTGIYPDMTGNVTFVKEEAEDVLYVSVKAVSKEEEASYVKIRDADGTIRKAEVETGFSDGVNIEIISGVLEGDTVLIESQVKADETE